MSVQLLLEDKEERKKNSQPPTLADGIFWVGFILFMIAALSPIWYPVSKSLKDNEQRQISAIQKGFIPID